MGLFGSLGLDWKLLLAQTMNFGLLLWLLTRFLYKPIVARIEKDERTLRKARTQLQTLERKEKDSIRERKQAMTKTKQRVRDIIQEAENVAASIRNRAQKEATQEKRAVIRQIHVRLKEIEDKQNDRSSY